MRECDAVMSAIPYYFNFELARAGGRSGRALLATSAATPRSCSSRRRSIPTAKKKGVTIIPDCGLAPGMVNILAEHGIRQLDKVETVRIYVGGLPQNPEPPLNYQIVYSLEGVLDYYTTLSWVLRDGKRTQVTALSELEPVQFPGRSESSRRFTPRAGCRRWRSATRERSRRWSTRPCVTRATRRSWRRFASSACSSSSRWM